MAFLDDRHKKKSFTITVIFHLLLLLLAFLFGLKYMDPPLEMGIAINFGDSDFGMGDQMQSETASAAISQQAQPDSPQEEEVLTQQIEDAPVISDEERPSERDSQTEERTVETPEPPKPDQATTDALSSIINASGGGSGSGRGDDNVSGIRGDPGADDLSNYYDIGTGLDGDGNYQLGGRKALHKKIVQQECNQEGIVVVDIDVDRDGKVTKAIPGVKGTTNNSRCLLEPARQAALGTRFNPDSNAPTRQMGRIIYRFRLSE